MGMHLHHRTRVALLTLAILLSGAPLAGAQSLDDLELKKAQQKGVTLKKKKTLRNDFSFGVLGIYETFTNVNRDRPEVGSLVWLAPQLKFRKIYRLQLNMGLYGYYLERSPNPWDLTDWSVQVSALRLYQEKHTGIALSGNLRYYIPLSVSSRNADSAGALRALLKMTRSVWKLYFAVELFGFYHFAKYTTWNSKEWWNEELMLSNNQATFSERAIVSYSPIKSLTLSLLYSWYQRRSYSGRDEAPDGYGSSLVADGRQSGEWTTAWRFVADATWNAWRWFYLSAGYSSYSPVLRSDARGQHFNVFNPKYGSVYLDLMFIY